ncbi:hypothetical protein A7A55_11020 [Acinetobacter baumannii]|nr:hypothetical protein A7A55_11020 [Acinetobacter baumannii]
MTVQTFIPNGAKAASENTVTQPTHTTDVSIKKLPGALQKIAFTVEGIAYIESTNLFGYEFSNELITDRNALKFNYPQGTTDMCGNAI